MESGSLEHRLVEGQEVKSLKAKLLLWRILALAAAAAALVAFFKG